MAPSPPWARAPGEIAMSVAEIPSLTDGAGATCASCGATLAPDQRYCLACGQPCSPVRLAFLDVLQHERQPPAPPGTIVSTQADYYVPAPDPPGATAWLRRYSGLFGLLTVLLLAVLLGLLTGHWVTQSKTPSAQVLRVEYPNGLPAAAQAAAPATTTSTTTTATASTSAPKAAAATEAKEAKEVTAAEKKPPPPPVKASSNTLQKLANSKGKQHEQEIEKLGNQPIETGGGSSGTSTPAKSESGKAGGGSSFQTIE
jgi:hypothetical protein